MLCELLDDEVASKRRGRQLRVWLKYHYGTGAACPFKLVEDAFGAHTIARKRKAG